jgi:hypothetical protein
MRKIISAGMWTVIVAGIGIGTIGAQQTAPPPQSSGGGDQRITVTGCLKTAPPNSAAATGAGATGTTGTAGAPGTETAGSEPKYVLADATSSPAADAPGATAASAPQTYRLIANASALSPHVGKKVELTGTVIDQDSSTRSSGAAPGGASAAQSAATGPALRVEAGKVISPACTQ